ncbi:ADP-ribosylation factor-like protein 6-interacting protein 6 [Vespula maculifrons]|uniref:ADP-ribosylation factor-like protein 6-interacting protein 6 n=1 Tax=Vespula maculifrons TaxID=7453 RepID=A0ABD2BZT8_VESMC
MFEKTSFRKNGVSQFEKVVNNEESKRMGIKKTLTKEWIIIFLVFLFLLLIVIEKIYFNYGMSIVNIQNIFSKQSDLLHIDILSHLYDLPNLSSITDMSESIAKQLTRTGTQFINTTNSYEKAIADVMIMLSTKYWWLMRAILSGMVTTSLSWLIIYMDSRIPGIDPPFPLNLLRKGEYRIQIISQINLNYLIGALIGLLVSIFMCFG